MISLGRKLINFTIGIPSLKSYSVYELLDFACENKEIISSYPSICSFLQMVFPEDLYGNMNHFIAERALFREKNQYYIPGNIGNEYYWVKVSPTESSRHKIQRYYCQNLSNFPYRRNVYTLDSNYLAETQAHFLNQEKSNSEIVSHYQTVKYFNREEREECRVFIIPKYGRIGKLGPSEGVFAYLNADNIEYTDMVVLTTEGELYTATKERYHIQHSSFTGAGPVLFAGYWHVVDGVIRSITTNSGHYRTTMENLFYFLGFLESRGYRVDDISLYYYDERFEEIISYGGNINYNYRYELPSFSDFLEPIMYPSIAREIHIPFYREEENAMPIESFVQRIKNIHSGNNRYRACFIELSKIMYPIHRYINAMHEKNFDYNNLLLENIKVLAKDNSTATTYKIYISGFKRNEIFCRHEGQIILSRSFFPERKNEEYPPECFENQANSMRYPQDMYQFSYIFIKLLARLYLQGPIYEIGSLTDIFSSLDELRKVLPSDVNLLITFLMRKGASQDIQDRLFLDRDIMECLGRIFRNNDISVETESVIPWGGYEIQYAKTSTIFNLPPIGISSSAESFSYV